MASKLRNKIIRIAHANPSLRRDLLPLLKTAGPALVNEIESSVDKYFELRKREMEEARKRADKSQKDAENAIIRSLLSRVATEMSKLDLVLDRKSSEVKWRSKRTEGHSSQNDQENVEIVFILVFEDLLGRDADTIKEILRRGLGINMMSSHTKKGNAWHMFGFSTTMVSYY